MAEGNVADAYRDLPISELIGQPFAAACKSNVLMAQAMYNYLEKVSFDKDGNTRTIDFDLKQPYTDPSSNALDVIPIHVEAPFIGLAPIPSLLIDNVTVDFTMTVSASVQETDTTEATFGGEGKSDNFTFNASVTASNERIRNTNQEASYVIHAEANQQQQTEGLSKLMDIMASCIAPMAV